MTDLIAKWPAFVLGARDPCALFALRAYARKAQDLGMDPEYVQLVKDIADDFDNYRGNEGPGDPDMPPLSAPTISPILEALKGEPTFISVHTDSFNAAKGFDATARKRL